MEHRLPYRAILERTVDHATKQAIVAGERSMTYGELGHASARLAEELAQRGVRPGDAVGVCLRARPEQLVAMLAAFRSGAVYLPLDPTHAVDLIHYEIGEARPAVIVAEPASVDALGASGAELIDIDTLELSAGETSTALNRTVDVDAPALVLFTSGTTGRPKGVRVSHRNLAQLVESARAAYGFHAGDVFSSIARYTFSISMFELLSPLTVGGVVHLSRREDVLRPEFLSTLLDRITVLHAGPSLLSRLSRYVQTHPDATQTFPNVRHVSTGGDIVLPDVMERMKVLFPRAELFVIYGCTESSCLGTEYRIPLTAPGTKSYVGRPFPGVGVRLIDEAGNPTAHGEVGEVCFSGAGLVPGYLNRPDVERERFVDIDGIRHYRTGDLGRYDDTGDLEFLGRNDFQVQVRGMRVELLGIENTVRELRLADECAATLRTFGVDDERLVAFVQGPRVEVSELRARLAERFPDYMVPQHVVPVTALPFTANGKLDRRGLADLAIPLPAARGEGESKSAMEQRIVGMFSRVLDVQGVGPEDSFFDLGGHSLLALELAERLEELLGVPVTPGAILQAPTARALVAQLAGAHLHEPILLNSGESPDPLFVVMGVYAYRELAKRLESRFSVYGVYVEHELSFLGDGAAAVPVDVLAARYLEIIQRRQKRGPYRLVGHSFGGLIAYELAQQLVSAGEEVLHLTMLDTMLPESDWAARLNKARRLVRLGPAGQVRWLGRRAKAAVDALRGIRKAEFGKHQRGRFAEMELYREDAYRRAEVAYVRRMAPMSLPTTLILAGRRLLRVPLAATDGGWTRLLPTIDQHLVDADHLDMLKEPGVGAVADLLMAM